MKEFRVHRGTKSNMKEFDRPFEAENYAYELSERYPNASVYLDKLFQNSYITIAKYRDGIQVNGVLYEQMF